VPRKFLKIFLAACLLAVPTTSHAQSQKTDIRPNANRLIGENLRSAFKGKTHSGAYNFTEKGKPTRFYEEIHGDDGRISYTENGRNCYYFYSDRDIEREDELDRDYWVARSVYKGQQPQCEASIS